MLIDYNPSEKTYHVACDHCHTHYLFEEYEIILEPWPHVECPYCGEWIPLF